MVQEVIHHHEGNSSGMQGMMFGLMLLILIGFLFFYFGLPAIRQSVPDTQINVPDQIDVNIQQQPQE